MKNLPIIQHWPKDLVFKTIILIVCQQVAAAASVYFLAKTGVALTSYQEIILVFTLFIGFSLIENLLVIPIRRTEVDSYISIYDRLLRKQLFGLKDSNIWSNKSKKSEFMMSIGLQMYHAASQLTSSIREIFSFSLGFVLNSLVFGLVLDLKFSLAFIFSCILTLIINQLTKNKLKEKADENKKSEVKFFEQIDRGWDNAVLSNPGVSNLYDQKYRSLKRTFLINAKSMYTFSEVVVYLSAVLSWLPVIFINLWTIIKYQANIQVLVSLMVLVPKQVQIINSIRVMSQFLTFFKMDKSSFDSIWKMVQISPVDLSKRIDFSKIKINDLPISNFNQIENLIKSSRSGRFTITGENGAGKSSLLALIKNKIEDAFLLPTAPNLDIGAESETMSFGQRLSLHLQFLSSIDVDIILLDEWDANLDKVAKSVMNQKITDLSLKKLVFEVRH